MRKTQTKLQQVYEFIVTYKRNNDGIPPTHAEIIDACHVSNPRKYLDELIEKHLLVKDSQIKVVGASWIPPYDWKTHVR